MALLDALLAGMQNPGAMGMPGAGGTPELQSIPGAEGMQMPSLPPDAFGILNEQLAKARAAKFGPFPPVMRQPYTMAGGPPSSVPPSTNDPMAREPEMFKDGVPLPRPRPTDPTVGEPTTQEISARAAASPVAEPPAEASPFSSIFKKLLDPANGPLLLALGGGLAGAPSFGTAISRGASAAAPAAALKNKTDVQQGSIAATYRALVAKGVPPADALAASYNPEIMKATAGKYFEAKLPTWGIIGHDEMMNPKYGFIDAANQTALPASAVTKPRVSKFEDALRLPKGTHFIDPNGVERIR